jgi:hypothetical protein
MPSKRDVLEQLKRDELLAAADRLGLEVRPLEVPEVPGQRCQALSQLGRLAEGASRQHPLKAASHSPQGDLRALGLDDSGSEKAVLPPSVTFLCSHSGIITEPVNCSRLAPWLDLTEFSVSPYL